MYIEVILDMMGVLYNNKERMNSRLSVRFTRLKAFLLDKKNRLIQRAKRGFTLIELMVVMAILAILATVGISIYSGAVKRTNQVKIRSDLETIAKVYETGFVPETNMYTALDVSNFPGGEIPKPPAGGSYIVNDPGTGFNGFAVCGDFNTGQVCYDPSVSSCLCKTSTKGETDPAVLLATPTPAPSATPTPTPAPIPGLIAHWTMDECTGTTLSDSTLNGNNGTLTLGAGTITSAGNCTTPGTTSWYGGKVGRINASLEFDGTDDQVSAGSPALLDDMSAFSISAWIYPQTPGESSRGVIISKVNGPPANGWFFRIAPGTTNALNFAVDYQTADLSKTTAASAINLNTWNHVVATWDGLTDASGVHLYVNGVETTYSGTPTDGSGTRVSDGAQNLIIGENGNGFNAFDGLIDDVRIYNRVLTPSEVNTLANLISPTPTPPSGTGTIALNPAVTYQTMIGWEATDQASEPGQNPGDVSPVWNSYKDYLMDQAVNDLGINRIRLEMRYNTSTSTFDHAKIDNKMNYIFLPMRTLMQARGEPLFLELSTSLDPISSSAFASGLLDAYQYLQSAYGILPDQFEMNEPPTFSWSLASYKSAMQAAGDLLATNSFPVVFSGPSHFDMTQSRNWANDIKTSNPILYGYLKEIAYHNYSGVSDSVRQDIASFRADGKTTAMTEHIGADYAELHTDLKNGKVSAWQQYTLAYHGTNDNGGAYYRIDNNASTPQTQVIMNSRTKFLRQYFKFIRKGAQRIEATSADANFDPVAFINTNGGYVVVVKATAVGSFSIGNLPAGTYGLKFTTTSQYDINLADQTISSGQLVSTSIPAAGVITIYKK